ncbi:MAG: hypothetical protein ACWGNB_04880 [Thiogranum sp.]
MNAPSNDDGVIAVLVERLEKQRLPRALSLKDKVDSGELLDDFDLQFLEQVFADAGSLKPLLDRHPEYQELASRMVHLYKEITDRAMENEKSR